MTHRVFKPFYEDIYLEYRYLDSYISRYHHGNDEDEVYDS